MLLNACWSLGETIDLVANVGAEQSVRDLCRLLQLHGVKDPAGVQQRLGQLQERIHGRCGFLCPPLSRSTRESCLEQEMESNLLDRVHGNSSNNADHDNDWQM